MCVQSKCLWKSFQSGRLVSLSSPRGDWSHPALSRPSGLTLLSPARPSSLSSLQDDWSHFPHSSLAGLTLLTAPWGRVGMGQRSGLLSRSLQVYSSVVSPSLIFDWRLPSPPFESSLHLSRHHFPSRLSTLRLVNIQGRSLRVVIILTTPSR